MLDRWFCWTLYGLDIDSKQAHDLLVSVQSFTADNCKLFSLLFEYNGQKVRAVMGAFFFLNPDPICHSLSLLFLVKMHCKYFFRFFCGSLMTQKLLLLQLF